MKYLITCQTGAKLVAIYETNSNGNDVIREIFNVAFRAWGHVHIEITPEGNTALSALFAKVSIAQNYIFGEQYFIKNQPPYNFVYGGVYLVTPHDVFTYIEDNETHCHFKPQYQQAEHGHAVIGRYGCYHLAPIATHINKSSAIGKLLHRIEISTHNGQQILIPLCTGRGIEQMAQVNAEIATAWLREATGLFWVFQGVMPSRNFIIMTVGLKTIKQTSQQSTHCAQWHANFIEDLGYRQFEIVIILNCYYMSDGQYHWDIHIEQLP